MRIDVAFLLHAYQPWWQFPHVLEKITDEIYRPSFQDMASDERFRMTMNINYSLLELFRESGLSDEMIPLLKDMTDEGRIELTSTSAYHAFLPLVTEEQANYQINLQEDGMKEMLPDYSPKGFFLPEMGYRPGLEKILSGRGYNWTVAEDEPYIAHHLLDPPYDRMCSVNGLGVFLRSKRWSFSKLAQGTKTVDGSEYARALAHEVGGWISRGHKKKKIDGEDYGYIVVALDHETFNHHKQGLWKEFMHRFLDKIQYPIDDVDVKMVTLSELYEKLSDSRTEMYIPPGSWSTDRQQYWHGNYYPLWMDKGHYHTLHSKMWEIYGIAQGSLDGKPKAHLDLAQGVNSCSWWQLPLGNPHLAHFGIDKMIESAEESRSQDIDKIYSLKRDIQGMGVYFPR